MGATGADKPSGKKKRNSPASQQENKPDEKQIPKASQKVAIKDELKVDEVSHGKFVQLVRAGDISKAIKQLKADTINKPVSGSGLLPVFYLLQHGLVIEEKHFEQLLHKGCDLHRQVTITIDGITLTSSLLLFAIHQYNELVESMMVATQKGQEPEYKVLEQRMSSLEQSLKNLLTIDRTGIDEFAQCIRSPIFPEDAPAVIRLTPLQYALTYPSLRLVEILHSFGANPNAPVKIGKHQYYPVHLACMHADESTNYIFQVLFPSLKTAKKRVSDIHQTDLTVASKDGSTSLHVLAEAQVKRLKNLEKTCAGQVAEQVCKDVETLCKSTAMLRKHGLDFGIKNKCQKTAEQRFRLLVKQELKDESLKQEALCRLAPLFAYERPDSAGVEAAAPVVSVPEEEQHPSTPSSVTSGKAHRKKRHKHHHSEMSGMVEKQPPAHEVITHERPVLKASDNTKAVLPPAKEPLTSAQDISHPDKKERIKQLQALRQKAERSRMGVTSSKSSGTSQASAISYEPDSVKLQRAALALGSGQLEQAIQVLTKKNIDSVLPGSGFPIIFHIFNYNLRLEERHVNSMIEKGWNVNLTPSCLIKEHKANFSVGLYAVHKIAELRTKIQSLQRKEELKEKEELIEHERTVYDNLSLLIKHGLDINMPAESLTEETLKAFTTAPVIMYRPIQLAIAKKTASTDRLSDEAGSQPECAAATW